MPSLGIQIVMTAIDGKSFACDEKLSRAGWAGVPCGFSGFCRATTKTTPRLIDESVNYPRTRTTERREVRSVKQMLGDCQSSDFRMGFVIEARGEE